MNRRVSPRLLARLQASLPSGEIQLSPALCQQYAADKWMVARVPEAVCLPRSAGSVAQLLRFASRHRIPVTARGAGHGYVGGCVPSCGGIVVSLERMNRIQEINAQDFVAVVQAGVVTQELQEAVEKQGLFYPPDPASRSDSTIGGNIATNAGGPRCLKYGVTRDYVLGLDVILPDGSPVQLGGRTHKNKTGFDLHRLFVGSEGLLGIITRATLKLLPRPPFRAALSVGYPSTKQAVRTIAAIFQAGLLPCAMEIADAFTLAAARQRTGSKLLEGCRAHLIVELDGQPNSVRAELKSLDHIVRPFHPAFVLRALGQTQCERIWQLRREFSYALRDTGLKKINEDIVVPRGRLEDLFAFAARLQRQLGLAVACFGHAGDGNIHVNLMVDVKRPGANAQAQRAADALFRQVLAWHGAITGEHGIGLAKKRWWPQAADRQVRRLHQSIKKALDPLGLLNPGKFV
jgi:glycolate oxidase